MPGLSGLFGGGGSGGGGNSAYTSMHIGLIGDSFTTTQGESSINAARALEQLNKAFGDVHEVYTSGLSGGFLTSAGSPTTQTIWETSPTGFAFNIPQSRQLPVLIIHCATNDLAAAVSNSTLFTALLALLTSIKTTGLVWKEVFYSTVCPRLGLESARNSWNNYVIANLSSLRAAGLSGSTGTEGLLLVDHSPYFENEAQIDLPGYKIDRTHPSDRGNIILARDIWAAQMKPVLQRRYPNLVTERISPVNIPGVKGIWIADSGITVDGSNNVTGWVDIKNGYNATSAHQPLYVATGGPWGLPIVRFNGSSQYLDVEAAALPFSNGKGKISVITAAKTTTMQTAFKAWVGRGTVSTANARCGVGTFLTTHWMNYAERLDSEGAGLLQLNNPPQDTQWHIQSAHNDFDNDWYSVYLDGYNIGSSQSAATKGKVDTTNTIVMRMGAAGSASSANSYFAGDMYGTIFAEDLTMGEMHMCEQWLNDKMKGACFRNWGIPL